MSPVGTMFFVSLFFTMASFTTIKRGFLLAALGPILALGLSLYEPVLGAIIGAIVLAARLIVEGDLG